MKLLIALLFTLSISVFASAKAKVDKYFELGTSLKWKKTRLSSPDVAGGEEVSALEIRATKGYIFKKHWDVSFGVKYSKSGEDQGLGAGKGKGPKGYGAQLGFKYVFNKRPGLMKHHHKTWMTPYIGVAYQWRRFSPHFVEPTSTIIAKTLEPGYLVSAGVRCFMAKNLAITWDLSYRMAKRVTTNKTSGAELANFKVREINPSMSFVYFY